MSNTLVSRQMTLQMLADNQSAQLISIVTGADSVITNSLEGSMEPLSSSPPSLPSSSAEHQAINSYMLNAPLGQELIPNNLNGQSDSTSIGVRMQHLAMPIRQAGQTQAMQPNSGQMKLSMPNKRKATAELVHDNRVPQKMCAPNRRVSQLGSSSKSSSPSSASMSSSPRPTASGRKVVQLDVVNKSHSNASKKNSQPQVSPKSQSESHESVRAKLRESFASALALVSKQPDLPSDGKMVTENDAAISQKEIGNHKPPTSGSSEAPASPEPGKNNEVCTSSITCPADQSNVVINGYGSLTKEMGDEPAQTWNNLTSEFQSNAVSSGADASLSNCFVFNDELLHENGISWVSDFNAFVPEEKKAEHTEQPERMHEVVTRHKKEETVESPESVAFKIELELFKLFGGVNKKYKEKGRSLLFNLKDRNNPELRERVMSGAITPHRLCSMTPEELASEELSQWRIAKAEELDHMKVLPDSEVNMRRLVKKTHKGEYQVDLDPYDGVSEEIPLDANVHNQSRSKTNGTTAAPPAKGQAKADHEKCEFTISSDGADLHGLMADDVRDLPPIVTLDEFMESLHKEPPFENLPTDSGRKTPESKKEELATESTSPGESLKHSVEMTSPTVKKVDIVSTKQAGGVKSSDSQKGLSTHAAVRLPKGEHVWEGLLQLNISATANFVALLKSGEKASTGEWPGLIEIKGRVKLDAFDKFVQALPMSRSRAIMVSHFVLNQGSTDTECSHLQEVVDSYTTDQRLGFAEPAPGVELYLCPPRTRTVDVIINHLPKSYTNKLNDIDNGLIGIVVWRKVQVISAISPKSSSHDKYMSKKQQFGTGTKNAVDYNRNINYAPNTIDDNANDDGGDDGDVPPGFGPPGSRDDDDLPEFNYLGNPNPPISHHRDLNLSHNSNRVEKMRELVQKYGQKQTNVPTQNWNDDDDDDDIPEWQPTDSQLGQPPPPPPPPMQRPAHNPVVLSHQHPMWAPPGLPLQPLQPPMDIQQQATWLPYGQLSAMDWRPNAPNYRGY